MSQNRMMNDKHLWLGAIAVAVVGIAVPQWLATPRPKGDWKSELPNLRIENAREADQCGQIDGLCRAITSTLRVPRYGRYYLTLMVDTPARLEVGDEVVLELTPKAGEFQRATAEVILEEGSQAATTRLSKNAKRARLTASRTPAEFLDLLGKDLLTVDGHPTPSPVAGPGRPVVSAPAEMDLNHPGIQSTLRPGQTYFHAGGRLISWRAQSATGGNFEIAIEATGVPCEHEGQTWPRIQLSLGGIPVSEVELTSTNRKQYRAGVVELGGSISDLALDFTNDFYKPGEGCDRNLELFAILIRPTDG